MLYMLSKCKPQHPVVTPLILAKYFLPPLKVSVDMVTHVVAYACMGTIYGHVHKNEIVGNNCIHCSHGFEVYLYNIMYPDLWVVFNVCRCCCGHIIYILGRLRPLCVVCIYKHVCAQQNSVTSLTLGGHALSVATATYGSPLVHVPEHMNMGPAD